MNELVSGMWLGLIISAVIFVGAYLLYASRQDGRDDDISHLAKILKGDCFCRAGEFPPSTWDDPGILKNIEENKKSGKELKFISNYYICIGITINSKFKPSRFLKTIIENKIPFKKCTDYKTLEKQQIDHREDAHYRIGTGVSYHFHNENNKREYWYTNSPLLKYFFKYRFNKNWHKTNYENLHDPGMFSQWEDKEIFVVEIENDKGYRLAEDIEIEKFKNFVKIDINA